MTKLNKMYYYTSTGEKKINCYYIPIPKVIAEQAQLENISLVIRAEKGKIIIEKK